MGSLPRRKGTGHMVTQMGNYLRTLLGRVIQRADRQRISLLPLELGQGADERKRSSTTQRLFTRRRQNRQVLPENIAFKNDMNEPTYICEKCGRACLQLPHPQRTYRLMEEHLYEYAEGVDSVHCAGCNFDIAIQTAIDQGAENWNRMCVTGSLFCPGCSHELGLDL